MLYGGNRSLSDIGAKESLSKCHHGAPVITTACATSGFICSDDRL
jgi:hypothetical protein